MSKIIQNGIFTLFVNVFMATVNMQTMFEHSLGHYMFNILPLSCECKMHELRNFNFSENLRPK